MAMKAVNCTMHLEKFKSWITDQRVIQAVESTCFKWFIRMGDPAPQNLQMIVALLWFYDKGSECFKFPIDDTYLDFGLQDILYITGLPIDGIHVSGFEDKNIVKVIMQHLCVDKEKAKSLLMEKRGKKCEQISPEYLKKAFQTVPTNLPDDAAFEPYVKAYLLYLIGVVLFPNKSNSIPVLYLALLQKEKINKYAWGAAVVAYLKCSMERACLKLHLDESASLDGFSYAILAFALERFSIF